MDLSRYNITGEKEAAETAAKNNARLVAIRWPYMILIFGVVVATMFLAGENTALLVFYAFVLGLGLVINSFFAVVVYLFKNRLRTQQLLTIAQLVFDIALAGIVTFVQGGIEARTTVLYVFPIMASALIFGSSMVTLAAALSGAGYVAALLLHQAIVGDLADGTELTVPMVFYPVVFLLIGRLVHYLQQLGAVEVREKAYDSFLSLMAHQLKHPASAVTTIIDAINHNEEGEIDETTRHYIDMLRTENENQIRLIDNLLEAAPHQRVASFAADVSITAMVEKNAQRLAESNGRLDDVQHLAGEDDITADVNPIRLGLALSNIFDNAFRYSEPGDKVQYSSKIVDDMVVITVRDGGRGMDEQELAGQLDRFATEGIRGMEQGHVGGLGLGLFASAQVARAHSGNLDITSSEGAGTTVILTIKKEQDV